MAKETAERNDVGDEAPEKRHQGPIKPIFFDPDRKRWPRLRLGITIVGFALSVLLVTFVLSIMVSPALPPLRLPAVNFLPNNAHGLPFVPSLTLKRSLTRQERALRRAEKKLARERARSLRQLLLARKQKKMATTSQQQLAIGFVVNWDDTSISSLKQNLGNLNMVMAEWLHLADRDGSISQDDPKRQVRITQYIRSQHPEMPIVPLINNYLNDQWEGAVLGRMLADRDARSRLVRELTDYVQGSHFAGISIDFENIPAKRQHEFEAFVKELSAVFRPLHLLVFVNVPGDDPAFNYHGLALHSDGLILMAYDEHWASGSPGPIAGLPWFAHILEKRQRDIPPEKMIVALGNYAYDWQEGHRAEELTFQEAMLSAKESQGVIHLDPASLNPTFEYADDQDNTHKVWILDAVTAFDQLKVINSFRPLGVALWRLGSEDPSIWNFFGRSLPLDKALADRLATMRFGYGLDYEGKGELLTIKAHPHEGSRELVYDEQRGFITGEHLTAFPSPYVIVRHGGADHKVALTFDDGPDPRFTPRILDVLEKAGVPATFFIIGVNGEMAPGLLRREIALGNEIGNHTFTHPDVSAISETQFQLELSATQHLLASTIGRYTVFFRPPYAVDSEPETIDQMRPLEIAAANGYLTVGMQIDPDDWACPGVDQIVQRTVEQATSGEGNIILLHDGGGDRSQTVKAIPRIVEELRSRGFQFVKVSDLLGQSLDQVMPPVPPESVWQTWLDTIAFGVMNSATTVIHWLFLLGIILGIARLAFIGVLAVCHRLRKRRRTVYDSAYSPAVAVIIPAYNEAKVIVRTITSLLACDHPERFEILVVDDGSTDGTYDIAVSTFADYPQVRIFTKTNGGKSAALNYGVEQSQAEIIVAMDADTIFTRDAILKLINHFADERVGAVAGNAKVGNRINLLTRWQALEYITSQNLDRRAFDVLNCITVVPGSIGAWRRELIERVGGFTPFTLAEDADLTLSIRRQGYAIVYEDEAIALTEAPDTVRGFVKQRYRWMYGTMQAAWKHRNALFRPRYGALGFVALPNVVIFQVLFPLISPIMDLLLVTSLGIAGSVYLQHPTQYSTDTLYQVLFYYTLFVVVDYLAAILAFAMEHREDWLLLIWLFWQRFFYRQLMYYVAIKSTLASLRGVLVGWGKLERKDTIKEKL